MNIRFNCPVCETPARVETNPTTATEWQCPGCDHRQSFPTEADQAPSSCLVCGNTELYKKKDFPHTLGLTILAVACLASVITHWLYYPWATWAILLGSAAFDGLLYLWVGDAVVCYRCDAHYRKVAPRPEHQAYELTIGERYRQERLRREQLEAEQQGS